jgi:hypothetical protein
MNGLKKYLSLGSLLLLAGCGGGPPLPQPADPARAREALRTALDAWQHGEQPSALANGSPAVHVNDYDWSAGQKLSRYRIADGEARQGVDTCFKVTLTLKDAQGRSVQKTVSYKVGTAPALTVVRSDAND